MEKIVEGWGGGGSQSRAALDGTRSQVKETQVSGAKHWDGHRDGSMKLD